MAFLVQGKNGTDVGWRQLRAASAVSRHGWQRSSNVVTDSVWRGYIDMTDVRASVRSLGVIWVAIFTVATASIGLVTAPSAAAETPTNGQLAVSVGRLDSGEDIWTMAPDGSSAENLTGFSRQANGDPSLDRFPSWSPDGSKIVFASNRGTNQGYRIWVMDADGSDAYRVTSAGGTHWESYPSWSPDGQWIIFTRSGGFGSQEPSLHKIRSNGSGETLILGKSSPIFRSSPRWSPDGSEIAFARISEATSDGPIATIPAAGGPVSFLNPGTGWSTSPDWSPDGSRIVYDRCGLPCGDRDVRVMQSDGSSDVLLVADAEGPTWSPDGKSIFYVRNVGTSGNPVYEGYIISPDGGTSTRIPIPFQGEVFNIFPEWDWQPAQGSFIDDNDSVFEADIEWMAGVGVTKGCNPPLNDRFCPDGVVTRGQMAAFLVRALGLTDRLDNPFTDDDGSIFEADIERLAAAGITKGCNPPASDRFCPDGKVTRGQMAAFLVRALGYSDAGGGDLFVDDDGSIFEADIDRLATAGVTKGCNPPTNDRFCPSGYVTRGQMAAFLHRALG